MDLQKRYSLHVSVPSHAPKPSKSMLLFTTTSSKESPIFPVPLILVPSALTKNTSILYEKINKRGQYHNHKSRKSNEQTIHRTHSSFC